MPYEINGLQSSQPQATRERGRTGEVANNTSSTESSRPEATRSGDRVSLTDAALRLQQLEQELGTHSEIDEARVAEIRQAIENGTLKIDARRIATGLLDVERMLSGG